MDVFKWVNEVLNLYRGLNAEIFTVAFSCLV